MEVSLFSPAKLNLFLAVTGRRADNFHDLVSVAAQLDYGDELIAETGDGRRETGDRGFTLECDYPEVPVDGSNLVLKAAEAFAVATGWKRPVHFKLIKRIPPGAGLGGGSSNAVAALRALNQLSGGGLTAARLGELAAQLGSDCALFVPDSPVVMRGRGDRIELLPDAAAARLRGRRVLLFKPSVGVGTAWAYGRMAARGVDYLPEAEAGAKLASWREGRAPAEELLFNNLEPAVFAKYPALPLVLEKLRSGFGLWARMSGSGSACFALLGDEFVTSPVRALIHECWGADAFVQETRLR